MNSLIKRSALYGLLVLAGAGAAWGVLSASRSGTAEAAQSQEPVSATSGAFGGPTIAGLCVLDRQRVFNASKVGRDANQHYRELRTAAQSQVSAEEAKVVADAKALEAQKSSLPPAKYQERSQQIAKQYQDLRTEATNRGRQLEATRQQAVGQISAAAQPVIASVYRDRHCGLLVDQASVLAGNPAMNVTDAVVAGLDAKLTTIALGAKPPAHP